ncbi:MAG: hypothetical protein ABI927_00945 [Gaiellaceae bacterium]
MRRLAALVSGVACALVLAGCNDVQQSSARRSLEAYLHALPDDGGYAVGQTRCTSSAHVGFVNVVATSLFICQAHRRDGICDRFRVVLRRHGPATITRGRRDAGCVLPLS